MGLQKNALELLKGSSVLDAGSALYLEALYENYLQDPNSVSNEWQHYFQQLPTTNGNMSNLATPDIQNALLHEHKQIQVGELIDAYRLLGHLQADIDPLKLREKFVVPELMLSYYHLSEADLDTVFNACYLPGPVMQPLKQILLALKKIYCETTAFEFMHIPDSPERLWVQEQVEAIYSQKKLSFDIKQRILKTLIAAEGLEKYLGAKYPGAKRFSLEGCDSLIVALDTIIQEAGLVGVQEIVLCMAHRGRLNVLVNLLGKLPSQLFEQFEGKHEENLESGDVKYHQGFSSNVTSMNGPVHLSLIYNPSHLEIVAPVASGSVKARQERRADVGCTQVLSVAMHGDASFAGQGVVMEILNMSQTRGFKIGGTIHIITNNQIGFTTSDPHEARSTLYCSDIGKMIEVPIFHVNADDPEAVYRVTQLALAYRTKFKKDIIIDLVGYRRQGHNEADEPAATQPIMYQIIRKLPPVLDMYAEKGILEQVFSKANVEAFVKEYRDALDNRQSPIIECLVKTPQREYASDWQPYSNKDWRVPFQNALSIEDLKKLALLQTVMPKDFVLHPRVKKIVEDRRLMAEEKLPLDWGFAETLAYATLLVEGFGVRLSGQDTGRGTFFHRQAELHNQTDGSIYVPLNHLSDKQGRFSIIDSLLSEEAVLAFEYGFSSNEPKWLTIWEAQFGDFANNAQVVIDQFISSGEQKWGRHSGLTLFLPHGYEGQGPEHSSARLERYMQLCAQHNIQVCVPTTPAQIYHLIRRQMLRPLRKPLIVLTPKAFLRSKLAASTMQDLVSGGFLPALPEIDELLVEAVKRVILCSGKVYYDLLEKRRADKRLDVAILRIEQLYPFPEIELQTLLSPYENAKEIIWCQEEPKNQGAWYSIQHHLVDCLRKEQTLRYAGRADSAAPAVGYFELHKEQQVALVQDAFS